MVIARPFNLRCPRCKEVMKHFTQIMFLSDYNVVVEGICCGVEVTSGPLNVLELFPTKIETDRTH